MFRSVLSFVLLVALLINSVDFSTFLISIPDSEIQTGQDAKEILEVNENVKTDTNGGDYVLLGGSSKEDWPQPGRGILPKAAKPEKLSLEGNGGCFALDANYTRPCAYYQCLQDGRCIDKWKGGKYTPENSEDVIWKKCNTKCINPSMPCNGKCEDYYQCLQDGRCIYMKKGYKDAPDHSENVIWKKCNKKCIIPTDKCEGYCDMKVQCEMEDASCEYLWPSLGQRFNGQLEYPLWKQCDGYCLNRTVPCNGKCDDPSQCLQDGRCIDIKKGRNVVWKKCNNKCINPSMPCNGKCDDYFKCLKDGRCIYMKIGDKFALENSENVIWKKCDGKCLNHTVPCNGKCDDYSKCLQDGRCIDMKKGDKFAPKNSENVIWKNCNGKCLNQTVPCNGKCEDYYQCLQDGRCIDMQKGGKFAPENTENVIWKNCNNKCINPTEKCDNSCDYLQCEMEDGSCEYLYHSGPSGQNQNQHRQNCDGKCLNLTMPCNGKCSKKRGSEYCLQDGMCHNMRKEKDEDGNSIFKHCIGDHVDLGCRKSTTKCDHRCNLPDSRLAKGTCLEFLPQCEMEDGSCKFLFHQKGHMINGICNTKCTGPMDTCHGKCEIIQRHNSTLVSGKCYYDNIANKSMACLVMSWKR